MDISGVFLVAVGSNILSIPLLRELVNSRYSRRLEGVPLMDEIQFTSILRCISFRPRINDDRLFFTEVDLVCLTWLSSKRYEYEQDRSLLYLLE